MQNKIIKKKAKKINTSFFKFGTKIMENEKIINWNTRLL